MQVPVLERAFQIARSGDVRDLRQLEMALRAEGYPQASILAHLDGRSVRQALKGAFATARRGGVNTAELGAA